MHPDTCLSNFTSGSRSRRQAVLDTGREDGTALGGLLPRALDRPRSATEEAGVSQALGRPPPT